MVQTSYRGERVLTRLSPFERHILAGVIVHAGGGRLQVFFESQCLCRHLRGKQAVADGVKHTRMGLSIKNTQKKH